MKKHSEVYPMTQTVAREFWDYDPETGLLTWRKVRAPTLKIGQEAGWVSVSLQGKAYRAVRLRGYGMPYVHRVIWLWVTGHLPVKPEEIDHEDGNGLNNRWENLRLVSGRLEQLKNKKLQKNNITGVTGVHLRKDTGKYRVKINVGGLQHNVGHFTHFEDAVAARKAASKKYGFHPNHGQDRPL